MLILNKKTNSAVDVHPTIAQALTATRMQIGFRHYNVNLSNTKVSIEVDDGYNWTFYSGSTSIGAESHDWSRILFGVYMSTKFTDQ